MTSAAALLRELPEALFEANRTLVGKGQQLFQQVRADGVPALVIDTRSGQRLLNSSTLFSSYDNLTVHLQAA
jgi:protein-disulfide isomerase-like protein with CxxC motif